MAAYKIVIQPCDENHEASGNNVKQVGTTIVPLDPNIPTVTIVKASVTQINGIKGYMAIINTGEDTSTIETAVNAILNA